MFGVVTACHPGDCFLVKATCASVRHFMPDVPICVIADIGADTSELRRAYGVIELPVAGLRTAALRELLPGSTRTKLAAMWEGPFDEFLWLDSDAVVWGDVRPLLNLKDYDWNVCAEWPYDAARYVPGGGAGSRTGVGFRTTSTIRPCCASSIRPSSGGGGPIQAAAASPRAATRCGWKTICAWKSTPRAALARSSSGTRAS